VRGETVSGPQISARRRPRRVGPEGVGVHPPVPPLPRPQAEPFGTQPRPERLTFSQTSSHGVVRGHCGAFEPKCSPKIQKSPPHGPSRRCGDGGAPSSCRFPCPSWVSPMLSIHGPRIATIRWFARLAGGMHPADAGRWGVLRVGV